MSETGECETRGSLQLQYKMVKILWWDVEYGEGAVVGDEGW